VQTPLTDSPRCSGRSTSLSTNVRSATYRATLNLVADAAVIEQLQPLLADLGLTATVREI
jgi:hypothetical protein